jgi:hypothetical protein
MGAPPARAKPRVGEGTPHFMYPEQFSAPQDVGPAADVFSLGSVLVYAATGHGPFDTPSPYETAIKVVDGEPELDGVPEELLPFVRLCLEKHPKSRPTTYELLTLLRDGHVPAPRPAEQTLTLLRRRPPSSRPRPRRRSLLLLTALATALLTAVAATVFAVTREDAATPGDLPTGWQACAEKAEGVANGDPFQGCAASGTSLVCAGDSLLATRFALADGRNTWSRPMDPTPTEDAFPEDGSLTTRDGRVYAYGADERDSGTDEVNITYTVSRP